MALSSTYKTPKWMENKKFPAVKSKPKKGGPTFAGQLFAVFMLAILVMIIAN